MGVFKGFFLAGGHQVTRDTKTDCQQNINYGGPARRQLVPRTAFAGWPKKTFQVGN